MSSLASLAADLEARACAWPSALAHPPPLGRLALTPRWWSRRSLGYLSPVELVRLHSLPEALGSGRTTNQPIPGTDALLRLWHWHGLHRGCLSALMQRDAHVLAPAARRAAAQHLLKTSGPGLSGAAMDQLLRLQVAAADQRAAARVGAAGDPAGSWQYLRADGLACPQTRYSELAWLVQQQPEGAHLVDLGSGFGRLGLVAGLLRPDLRFTGLELVPERVEAAVASVRALGLPDDRIRNVHANVQEASIPAADTYYLFFPFPKETAHGVFSAIRRVGQRRAVRVVLQGSWPGLDLRDQDWLEEVPAPEPFRCFQSRRCASQASDPAGG